MVVELQSRIEYLEKVEKSRFISRDVFYRLSPGRAEAKYVFSWMMNEANAYKKVFHNLWTTYAVWRSSSHGEITKDQDRG